MLRKPRQKTFEFRIVKATVADFETLVSQRHNMFEDIRHRKASEHKFSDERYRKWIKERLGKREFVGFVAVDNNGEPLGGGCVWLRDSQPSPTSDRRLKSPYLMSMYTKPKFRGNGIATAIVREAMRWCKKRGYRTMILHASQAGRPVYTRLGWKRTWEMRVDLTKYKMIEDQRQKGTRRKMSIKR